MLPDFNGPHFSATSVRFPEKDTNYFLTQPLLSVRLSSVLSSRALQFILIHISATRILILHTHTRIHKRYSAYKHINTHTNRHIQRFVKLSRKILIKHCFDWRYSIIGKNRSCKSRN